MDRRVHVVSVPLGCLVQVGLSECISFLTFTFKKLLVLLAAVAEALRNALKCPQDAPLGFCLYSDFISHRRLRSEETLSVRKNEIQY